MASSVVGHQPPPFFKRGPAPLAKLVVLLSVSLTLVVVDHRLHYLEWLRQAIAVVTTPLQMVAGMPVKSMHNAGQYFEDIDRLRAENAELKRRALEVSVLALRQEHLDEENTRLRALLDMSARQRVEGQVADVLYAARDPFSRRIVIGKGYTQGLVEGAPVVDELGVIGQVTRLYPLTAEVTLISDKDQALPVQIRRTGMRAVMFGVGNGYLELRYLAANADVKAEDVIITSGLDGVFAPGLPVARVISINRDNAGGFARILCAPASGVEAHGQVLVLSPHAAAAPPVDQPSRRETAGPATAAEAPAPPLPSAAVKR